VDFSLSDEQVELRDLARKILEDIATNDRLKEIESKDPVCDEKLWGELAKANLLGVAIPEEFGGSGFTSLELFVLLQEIGRAVAPVPAVATLALAALPIAAWGSAAQQQAWLSRIAEGDAILTSALIEHASTDPLDPATTATRAGEGWILRGEKSNVPAGSLAERVLTPARLDDGRVGVFLVDPRSDGIEVAVQPTSDRQPYAQITLSGAEVNQGDLLGDLDRGEEILRWLVDHATIALCAVQLGVCERGLEMTAAYSRERIQFDRPIGSFQAVHQRAADAFIHVEAQRLTTWEAAWQLGQGLHDADTIATAKFWAAESGQFVSYACQHLHGGIGIDVDYPMHRYFLWAIQNEHTLGAASAQLAEIGRRLAENGLD
jgi:alkylation response protein AidB-like acyl-CoA dehydrogenase